MLSIDTNLLFHAVAADRPEHARARAWMGSLKDRQDVALSELVLVEFYRLLRNPAVSARPLSAPAAAQVIQRYRGHPYWRILGFPRNSKRLHDNLWTAMAKPGIAYRRIFDVRLALSLLAFGVTEFATTNLQDFEGLGFERVWNPLVDASQPD